MSPKISSKADGKTTLSSRWTAAVMRTPVLAVDAVIVLPDRTVVFVQRRNPPFQGAWALPGGLCEVGETVEQAVRREAKEETGLQVEIERLIGVFSDPGRDPRGHTVSVAFLTRVVGGQLRPGSDAAQVQTFKRPPQELAFDHRRILAGAGVFEADGRVEDS
jgi:8-oxo-dGTP diphosphatase